MMYRFFAIVLFGCFVIGCGSSEGTEASASPTPMPSFMLEEGTYLLTSGSTTDACGIDPRPFKDAFEADLTRMGDNLTIAGERFKRDGNNLTGPIETELRNFQLTHGKDCIVSEEIRWQATVVADNAFDLSVFFSWSITTGDECTPELVGVLAVPCESSINGSFEWIE